MQTNTGYRPLLLNATSPVIPTVKEEDVLRKRRKLEKASESEVIEGEVKDQESDSPDHHRDEYQVELDVNRSFVHLPIGMLSACTVKEPPF